MREVAELPNIEAAVNGVLNDAGIDAYSELPGEPEYPLVVTERLGGVPPVPEALDGARIQMTSWGANKTQALATIKAARTAVYRAEATTVDSTPSEPDVWISGVEDESVNLWIPDPRTGRARYMTTLRVTSRIAVGGSA